MPANYFVQIADANIYFDVNRRKCANPCGYRPEGGGAVYFVRSPGEIALMQAEWDTPLAGFTEDQRTNARLWERYSE